MPKFGVRSTLRLDGLDLPLPTALDPLPADVRAKLAGPGITGGLVDVGTLPNTGENALRLRFTVLADGFSHATVLASQLSEDVCSWLTTQLPAADPFTENPTEDDDEAANSAATEFDPEWQPVWVLASLTVTDSADLPSGPERQEFARTLTSRLPYDMNLAAARRLIADAVAADLRSDRSGSVAEAFSAAQELRAALHDEQSWYVPVQAALAQMLLCGVAGMTPEQIQTVRGVAAGPVADTIEGALILAAHAETADPSALSSRLVTSVGAQVRNGGGHVPSDNVDHLIRALHQVTHVTAPHATSGSQLLLRLGATASEQAAAEQEDYTGEMNAYYDRERLTDAATAVAAVWWAASDHRPGTWNDPAVRELTEAAAHTETLPYLAHVFLFAGNARNLRQLLSERDQATLAPMLTGIARFMDHATHDIELDRELPHLITAACTVSGGTEALLRLLGRLVATEPDGYRDLLTGVWWELGNDGAEPASIVTALSAQMLPLGADAAAALASDAVAALDDGDPRFGPALCSTAAVWAEAVHHPISTSGPVEDVLRAALRALHEAGPEQWPDAFESTILGTAE